MASIQDVANAAYRIERSGGELADRLAATAQDLQHKNDKLIRTVRGSRSGEDAVQQVAQATQVLRQSAAQLKSMESDIQRFITDLTK